MSVFPSLVRPDCMANALCVSLIEKKVKSFQGTEYFLLLFFFSEPRIIDVNLLIAIVS